jgi:hypothetical protein
VKSQNGRGIGDGVLRASGARGGTCSKYCVGLNLVRPGLRYNVFKQLLRTHFAWTPQPGGALAGAGNERFLTGASSSSPLARSGSQA